MHTAQRIGVNGKVFDTYEILICTHCLISLANGECSDPTEHTTPEDCPSPFAEWPEAESITLGRSHQDGCDGECDGECDRYGFSQSSCDGCGDWHHGDREYAAVWVPVAA